jgi:UPF0716 protein FxsA
MPAWVFLMTLLFFPVAEALTVFWAANTMGWWTLAWLISAFVAGLQLIRFERLAFAPRMLFNLQQGQSPFRSLYVSTRLFLAGGLLMFPGLITDVIAFILLLLPGTWRKSPATQRGAADDVIIEGEFSREGEVISDRFPRREI